MEDGNRSGSRGSGGASLLEEGALGVDEVRRAVGVLFEDSAVVELRAFKGRETVSGYFDDHEALAREAHKRDREGYAVYVTLNEVNSALLHRSSNRARKVWGEPTTSD